MQNSLPFTSMLRVEFFIETPCHIYIVHFGNLKLLLSFTFVKENTTAFLMRDLFAFLLFWGQKQREFFLK